MRNSLFLIALLLTGCASDQPAQGRLCRQCCHIKLGVIESVTPIELDASTSGRRYHPAVFFGQVGGASTGSGRGAAVGSILGTVLGGTFGQQSGIATKPGLEIWVRLEEEGKSTYVMQPGKPDTFKVGDRVRVVRKNGETRVEPMPAAETPKDSIKP